MEAEFEAFYERYSDECLAVGAEPLAVDAFVALLEFRADYMEPPRCTKPSKENARRVTTRVTKGVDAMSTYATF